VWSPQTFRAHLQGKDCPIDLRKEQMVRRGRQPAARSTARDINLSVFVRLRTGKTVRGFSSFS